MIAVGILHHGPAGQSQIRPGRERNDACRNLHAAIANRHQHRKREASAGTVTSENDRLRGNAFAEQIAIAIDSVAQSRWKRKFRREPVGDRKRRCVAGAAELGDH